MTKEERIDIIKIELRKVRDGWENTLILCDGANNLNFVQFTESVCEVSANRMKATKLTPLSKKQSKELQSFGFQEPQTSKDEYNFSLNWENMSIESVVEIVAKAFSILGSHEDFELIVEN
jgi:hypothetical protein